MTRKWKWLAAFVACVLWAVGALAQLSGDFCLTLEKDSRLWLEGDSNIHAFESVAEVLDLQSCVFINDPGISPPRTILLGDNSLAGLVTNLVLTIPIEEMKSPTKGLSSRMHSTLKYKEFPNIVFKMTSYAIDPERDEAGQVVLHVKGDVSLAGVTKPIEIRMTGGLVENHMFVQGEKTLLMTDFGIEPPTMMFGKIKVYDEIVIKWELQLGLVAKGRRAEATE